MMLQVGFCASLHWVDEHNGTMAHEARELGIRRLHGSLVWTLRRKFAPD